VSPQNPSSSPLLFISHKRVDKKIADIISSFVTMHSGGRINVYQSSSPWSDAPKVGRNLNKQLRETLWNTSALILIYTGADHDWSYCMWECGVASHPQSPDTKIILFQGAENAPSVFAEQVNVNMRELADIQKFTNEFLTATDFFPGFPGPITKFKAAGREVSNAATDLFQKLEPVLPPDKVDPSTEWPSYPFLQLELGFEHIDQFRKLDSKERNRKAGEIIKRDSVISDSDKYCEQLFGVLSFPTDMTFKKLTDSWTERFPHSQSRWIQALCSQVQAAAMWNFPTTSWDVMQGFNDNVWRAPVLTRVRKIPSRRCVQFDIYFFKFDLNALGDAININIPTSTKSKRSSKKADKSRSPKKHSGKKQAAKGKRQKAAGKPRKRKTPSKSTRAKKKA
jgi:hypothetical protein